jgi:hypothetical protein
VNWDGSVAEVKPKLLKNLRNIIQSNDMFFLHVD